MSVESCVAGKGHGSHTWNRVSNIHMAKGIDPAGAGADNRAVKDCKPKRPAAGLDEGHALNNAHNLAG